MNKNLSLCFVAACLLAFGATALYLGYNNTVISSVFAGLGAIAGYLVGEREYVKEAERTFLEAPES